MVRQKLDRVRIKPDSDTTAFIQIQESGLVAEIDQHRMVLEIKLFAEGIEAAIPRPARSVIEPPRQLLDEDLLTHLA